MTPEEYLAIPYVLVVESVEGPDGQWFRRAMYPELGISGEALSKEWPWKSPKASRNIPAMSPRCRT